MFKYLVLFAVIAAVNADGIENFIKGERYIIFNMHPHRSKDLGCSKWFNVSNTQETCNCGPFTNVPILKFAFDNGLNFTLPVLYIKNDDDLKNAVLSKNDQCDTEISTMKMQLLETDNHFYESEIVINANSGTEMLRSYVFAKSVPKKSELMQMKMDFDNVLCYEDDTKE